MLIAKVSNMNLRAVPKRMVLGQALDRPLEFAPSEHAQSIFREMD